MRDATLEQTIFREGGFINNYNYFRKTRFFYVDSVLDFCENRDSPTYLSNLIFLSNPDKRLFLFNDCLLKKSSDKIYNLSSYEDNYFAKIYSISDETGEYSLFWPTKDSKIPFSVPCDDFEIAKNFRGEIPKEILVAGFKDERKDAYIYHINFNESVSRKRIFNFNLKKDLSFAFE